MYTYIQSTRAVTAPVAAEVEYIYIYICLYKLDMYIYIYIHIYIYIWVYTSMQTYVYIYIYIYIYVYLSLSISIYIYIYIYREREREICPLMFREPGAEADGAGRRKAESVVCLPRYLYIHYHSLLVILCIILATIFYQ